MVSRINRAINMAKSGVECAIDGHARPEARTALAVLFDKRLGHRTCRRIEARRTLQSIAASHKAARSTEVAEAPTGIGGEAYILGSGPSITDLDAKAWERIALGSSYGFNRWFRHEFVPNYYFAQAPHGARSVDEQWAREFRTRSQAYSGCHFLLRGDILNQGRFAKSSFGQAVLETASQVNVCSELYLMGFCEAEPANLVSTLASRELLNPDQGVSLLPKMGATLPLILAHCVRQRHDTIVLCGIDMNEETHFFDAGGLSTGAGATAADGGNEPIRPHPHMDRTVRNWTVKDYVLALRTFARNMYGAEVYVSSSKSALAPDLPVWSF